jgi:hypothetical protein
MKKLIFCASVCMALVCLVQIQAHAQFLKKLKDKAKQVLDKKASDAVGLPADNTQQQPVNNSSANSSDPANRGGGGLKNTPPPDVNKSINDAETSSTATDYANARYSLQQAMTGVEIELGRQLLQSLPPTVDGLNKDTTKNLVSSYQYGWSNLTIQTVYSDGKDKQMKITMGNIPAYATMINMYFNNAALIQSSGSNQNMKQTRVKGNQALIQYDDSKGYSLYVQLGQGSMIMWECVNFATEDEVMTAANTFDIDGIKKMMGEQ